MKLTLDMINKAINIDYDKLMIKEKERLGFPKDKLVFIGMANLSKYYWCAWQTFLHSKEEEESFFGAYYDDRLYYSKELNLIKSIPEFNKKSLNIGDNITIEQIQKLLKTRKAIIPDKKEIARIKKALKTEIDPFSKGEYYQTLYAEKYPSIRWNFKYNNIIVIGIPDGITDDFVYEFKYTKKRYFNDALRRAKLQADLYGYFFNRKKKRVQIYCEEEDKVYTFDEEVNKEEVIDILEKWRAMIKGELPIKPMAWKCFKCEFKNKCILLKE